MITTPSLERMKTDTANSYGQIVLAITTSPAADSRRIATELVSRGVVACVNIIPGATSVYQWKGTVNVDQEDVLLMKLSSEAVSRLKESLPTIHPYELPELIVLNVTDGLAAYIEWVRSNSLG